MYTCYECQSNNFEEMAGFLFCADCHVQHPDYLEQSLEHTSMAVIKTLNKMKMKKEKTLSKKNWTLWEAFNYILLGFVGDLTATGLTSSKLKLNTLSLWSGFLDSSGLNRGPEDIKCIGRKKRVYYKDKAGNKSKKEKLVEGSSINQTLQNSVLTGQTNMRKMIYKKHKKFFNSQSTEACSLYAEETLETIAKSFAEDNFPAELSSKSVPETSGMKNTKRNSRSQQKYIILTKARILEILHMALLIERSNIHLGDLIRFIREAHLSYAKITHFLPEDIKITRGDCTSLETLHSVAMPKHAQQRILGAEIARTLKIEDFPFPDMKYLITRYCKDLNLSEKLVDHALVVAQMAAVKNICSFRKSRREIPNYEGMAAACLIYVMKILFGLDDETEFLLSDMAEKTNRLLNSSGDAFLFSFKEWQKFIELRKTILKIVHYPTEEKFSRSELIGCDGLIDMVLKESKDTDKEKRFTAYKEYFMDPELMEACQEVLTILTKPKEEFQMDFSPSLTPYSSYLDTILHEYERKTQNNVSQNTSLPQLHPRILDILRTNYKSHDVSFIFELEKYKELLAENGFNVKNISKIKQCKIEKGLDKEGKKRDEGSSSGEEKENNYKPSGNLWNSSAKILLKRGKSHPSPCSKINFLELSSSKDVYLVDDMTLTWELRSPKLDDTLEISFLSEVFEKTPINFQWLVRELSYLLEMTERDIYVQLYRLERSVTKALVVHPSVS